MKIMITTTTKDTHKRLSTNSENGSFQNRPHLIFNPRIGAIKISNSLQLQRILR